MGESFSTLVHRAAARRRLPPDTTAYRLVNAEGDGLPGVTVDWFAGVAVVSLYRELEEREEGLLLDAVQSAARAQAVYLKRRPREARTSGQRLESLAPEAPVRGEPVPELVASEAGLRFLIRPGQGLSVGLYLDARELRAWVREASAGRTVLNTFAYTCGFSVAALAGGAARAVSIDVSRRVLDWGEENARLNGFTPRREDFIAGDVFEWLGRLRKKGAAFELVILDPPSFATTRRTRFSAASGYGELVELAAPVVAPGGTLLACCNLAGLPGRRFESVVLAGLARAGRPVAVERRLGPSPIDFPTHGEPALKALVVRP